MPLCDEGRFRKGVCLLRFISRPMESVITRREPEVQSIEMAGMAN